MSKNNYKNISEKVLIYGKHPVLMALKNQKRKFYKIYTSNSNELKKYIIDNSIANITDKIEFKNNNELNKLFKEEVNHQGYVALVSVVKKLNIDDFINENKSKKVLPKLLILDQLTDPHNVGAIIRTAVAFGIKYIITTRYNSQKDSAIVVKSSAGMSEIVDIVEVINLQQTIEKLKTIGYFIVGLAGEGKEDLKNIKDGKNLCLIVGNEGNGIRQLVKKNCDVLCRINIAEEVESLNASVATAIAIYQLWSK